MNTLKTHSMTFGTAKFNQRLQSVLSEHLDPAWGSAFWIDRARKMGIDESNEICDIEQLHQFGDLSQADLQARPLMDYIPRRYYDRIDRLIIGQTGGTIRSGTWTAYLPDEFHEAFVEPFLVAAKQVEFPQGLPWLFVGPSGPHLIGKAACAIAQNTGSAEPFMVDFDPRWARKMPANSIGAQRYMQHIIDQAMAVIDTQSVGVLFATPPVLLKLAETMSVTQRRRIRGVHYGGMAVETDTLNDLQNETFPDAVHLSGYGNTLLGCCLALSTQAGQQLDYFPFGDRLYLEVVDDEGLSMGFGQAGRVRVTRLDHAMMIIRLVERDQATLIEPPADVPAGFTLPGLHNPRPIQVKHNLTSGGLY